MSGATSDVTILSTGTPQGCVLSPVLYTVYTNDCASQCSGVFKIKYADDLACCGLIQGGDEGEYRREMSSIENWSNEQKLFINKNKTKVLIIDFRKGKKEHAPVKIGTETIEEVNSFVYLGTTITSDLTWSDHCFSTLNKYQQKCTS